MRDTHEIDGEIAYTIPQGLKNRCLRDFLYKIIIPSIYSIYICKWHDDALLTKKPEMRGYYHMNLNEARKLFAEGKKVW